MNRPTKKLGSSELRPPWSDLTPLALERIRDLLDSDLYDVRLRSVCSNWRKSLLLHRRPTKYFPINLPAIPEEEEEEMLETDRPRKPLIPNCSRIYRISPADDPSHGWLIRSLDTKPNTFTLLDPLRAIRVRYPPPASIPNSIDLLRFRISEICKCYRIDGVEWNDVTKVLFLPSFVESVAFTVLVVFESGNLYYCNDGDSAWTEIETAPYYSSVDDVALFNGVCYVLFGNRALASLNSSTFHLTMVLPPVQVHLGPNMRMVEQNNLVIFESDLFLVSVHSGVSLWDKDLRIFKWVLNSWCEIKDLGDAFLLSSSDAFVGLSAKDFKGCKGNFVFFSDAYTNLPYEKDCIIDQDSMISTKHQVYDLDQSKTLLRSTNKLGRINMCWPPPEWIKQPTTSS